MTLLFTHADRDDSTKVKEARERKIIAKHFSFFVFFAELRGL